MKYQKSELEKQIKAFIMEKCETEQWDFKQEWHEKTEDLIKDIICFANTVHDKDCFLIFGISDDHQIVGMTKPRRKQADILDALNNLLFAGDIVPKIELHTIRLNGKELDVLIVYNTNQTPIYLKKTYGPMKIGCIYTRTGDKNTPNNGNAEHHEIEMLWKKRFGLTKSSLDFIYDSMNEKYNWKKREEDWYYIYKPEYVIHTYCDEEFSDNCRWDEFYSYSQVNESTTFKLLDIILNQTVLENYQIVCLDSGRLVIPAPECGFINDSFYSRTTIAYKYYSKGTRRYTLLKFMYNSENDEEHYAFDNLSNVVLIFKSENERLDFEEYITYNFNIFNEKLSKSNRYDHIKTDSEQRTELYKKKLNIGFVLNEMLLEFRKEYGE